MINSTEANTETWKVGIGEFKITKSPHSLKTIGLGSCVGIVVYDSVQRIGGLSHIMLPDSTIFNGDKKIGKFADLAIPVMVTELIAMGANERYLQAKISGGSSMFQFTNQTSLSQIGKRNIEAVKTTLTNLGIPLLGEDTGGTVGRTMWIDMTDMTTRIKAVNQEIMII